MAQLRFKQGKCIEDNFYVRGDGTRCYFFTQEDVRRLFEGAGFVEDQNLVDRRLQVIKKKVRTLLKTNYIQGKSWKKVENVPSLDPG